MRHFPADKGILAVDANANGHVALIQWRQYPWNVTRVVLAVAIHKNYDVSASAFHAVVQSSRLPGIVAEPNQFSLAPVCKAIERDGWSAIRAAIIDQKQFVFLLPPIRKGAELIQKGGYDIFLVVDGDNDRISVRPHIRRIFCARHVH